jgi:hypothetical protein
VLNIGAESMNLNRSYVRPLEWSGRNQCLPSLSLHLTTKTPFLAPASRPSSARHRWGVHGVYLCCLSFLWYHGRCWPRAAKHYGPHLFLWRFARHTSVHGWTPPICPLTILPLTHTLDGLRLYILPSIETPRSA